MKKLFLLAVLLFSINVMAHPVVIVSPIVIAPPVVVYPPFPPVYLQPQPYYVEPEFIVTMVFDERCRCNIEHRVRNPNFLKRIQRR
jgi:hypothetical protein